MCVPKWKGVCILCLYICVCACVCVSVYVCWCLRLSACLRLCESHTKIIKFPFYWHTKLTYIRREECDSLGFGLGLSVRLVAILQTQRRQTEHERKAAINKQGKGRKKAAMNVWHKTKRQAATISQSSLAKWFNKVNTDTLALTPTNWHTYTHTLTCKIHNKGR